VLRNRDDDGLVISGGVDGTEPIGAGRKTVGDISGEFTPLGCCVETLEESKLLGVCNGCLIDGLKCLDDYMGVALDLTLTIQELRGRKVICVGINEKAGLHAPDRHFDGEGSVRLDGSKVLGICEFG